jgi:ACS family glucarate transporter-like MFS transporter
MKSSARLIWLLAMVSFVGYALRSNITIAQEYMKPELGLTDTDMGLITGWGFLLAYAFFQIPGGVLGDRFGARAVLAVCVGLWGAASFASGAVPAVAGVAFVTLLASRIVLGIAQGPTYPVSAMAAVRHVPPSALVGASAIYLAAATLGSALAPLTLAPLMVQAGWRSVFVASGVVGLATALIWYVLAPVDSPTRAVLALDARPSAGAQWRAAIRLRNNGPLMVLCGSYFLHSAVYYVFLFWFFQYLIQGRGFDILASGVGASVPNFMACAVAPLVGAAADQLRRRMSPGRSRRLVGMSCLIAAATFVLIGAYAPNAWMAIACLSISVSGIVSAEAPFWTVATTLSGQAAGAAGGVLNLMGNLGGFLSVWLVPHMKDAWGWTPMLVFWAAVALVAALLWLFVADDRPVTATDP